MTNKRTPNAREKGRLRHAIPPSRLKFHCRFCLFPSSCMLPPVRTPASQLEWSSKESRNSTGRRSLLRALQQQRLCIRCHRPKLQAQASSGQCPRTASHKCDPYLHARAQGGRPERPGLLFLKPQPTEDSAAAWSAETGGRKAVGEGWRSGGERRVAPRSVTARAHMAQQQTSPPYLTHDTAPSEGPTGPPGGGVNAPPVAASSVARFLIHTRSRAPSFISRGILR